MLHYHSQWCEKSDSFMQEAAVVWRRRPLRAFWRETLRARLRNGGAVKRRALSRTLRAAMSTPSALTVFIWRGRIWKRSTSDKLGLRGRFKAYFYGFAVLFFILRCFWGLWRGGTDRKWRKEKGRRRTSDQGHLPALSARLWLKRESIFYL